jgi:thioredoxin-dependent peroxiredoxin
MPLLSTAQKAPNFSVPSQDDAPISLAEFSGRKNLVLYFYPKDDTPGCTIEANQFTALASEFARHDTVVFGISKDTCDTHKQFIKKYNLKVDLLSDTEGKLCNAYGVWQEKEKNGVKTMGIVRSTFIVNKKGILADVEYGVNPDGHAQKVLEKVQAL